MRRPTGLAQQVAGVMCLVVVVTVLLSGLVAVGLVRGAYDSRAHQTLRQQAVLFAELVDRSGRLPTPPVRDLRRVLSSTGVRVVLVSATGAVPMPTTAGSPPMLPGDVVAAVRSGAPVSQERELAGSRFLIEGQPTAAGGAVVLLQRARDAGGVDATVLRRFGLALLLGVLGGVAVGIVLARRLARPLVAAAGAARVLARGRRDVRLVAAGPREVADLADGLNALAGALAVSEGRQREFLLSVSHELRTPLTAVRGFAEALADGVATGEEARRAGVVVGEEAARLQRLVDDLLDLARLGSDTFTLDVTEGDLTALLDQAAAVWQRRCATAGVVLQVEGPGRPVPVRTDLSRVRQVLDGLAENALRVTPRGRPVVLALALADDGVPTLQVRDGGPGLTDEDFSVAFDRGVLHGRYRQVRPSGTGIGLALVRGLVDRLGGTVDVGHAPEGGAAFTVRLAHPTT